MADRHEQPTEAQQQESSSSNISTSSLPVEVGASALSSNHTPSSSSGDPAATEQLQPDQQPSRRSKRWPAYFFPSLASQRTSFCLDVLKREDIKSVRDFSSLHHFLYPNLPADLSFLMANYTRDSDITVLDGDGRFAKLVVVKEQY